MGRAVHPAAAECRSVSILATTGHTPSSFCARKRAKTCGTARRSPKNGPRTARSDAVGRAPHPDPPGRIRRELPVNSEQTPLRRTLLNGWIAIAGRFGAVQTLLILAL